MTPDPITAPAAEPAPELRRRLRDGQPDAFDAVAVAFFGDLSRYAQSMLGCPEAAFDAVQEAFLTVLERHRLYDPERPLRPWLFAVCRNCCLQQARRRSAHEARVVSLEATEEEVRRLAADAPSPSELARLRESEEGARRLLAELSPEQREIVVLHLFEEFTFREIGELTGRPLQAVAATYYRSLQRLRRVLAESGAGSVSDVL
ncbi:MAG: sigma-70 family RNA polymerase sigma factor [Candidatus Sumerlaeia bacterium]|nr:sigma-70 family RNA polymerase sigma factor [Candidatus Sumerlaeia bacterium]